METKSQVSENVLDEETLESALIIDSDFKIEKGNAPARYNLYVKKIVNKGKSSERVDWGIIGYDYTLEHLLLNLTSILTDRKFPIPTDLRTYLQEYMEMKNWIKNQFKPLLP